MSGYGSIHARQVSVDFRGYPPVTDRTQKRRHRPGKESEIMAAGFNTDSLWDICRDVTQDTAVSLRRLVFSYQRSALERSPCCPVRSGSGNPKAPCTTPSCRAAPDWSPARGWAASCVRHRRATSPRPGAATGNRMPKMRERRIRQIVVGDIASTRSTESDQPAKFDRIISIGRWV